MEDLGKEIIEKADGVALEVYKDAVQPAAKPIGEILGFIPRTIRLWLRGWEKWLINGEASVKLAAEAIEEKIRRIPDDKVVEPEAYVAVPAIQQLTYCQDNPVLRDLYANLLVSSMNADSKWRVHPSFVDIIKQLNPDEAKLLHQLKKKVSYPLIDIRLKAPSVGYNDIVVNFTAVGNGVVERIKSVSEYLDNLSRLGLIRISQSYLMEDSRYDETIRLSESLFQVPEHTRDGWKRTYKKHLFELTDFGESFVTVVVDPESRDY